MDDRARALAERMKLALDSAEGAAVRATQDRERLREEGRAARAALFDDLAAFASLVGHLDVERREEGVTLSYGGSKLAFDAVGDDDRVKVTFAIAEARGEQHRLYRERGLQDRWVWVSVRFSQEERQPLFERGLEDLLVRALALPRVSPAITAESPMSRRLAEAMLKPPEGPPRELPAPPPVIMPAKDEEPSGSEKDEPGDWRPRTL